MWPTMRLSGKDLEMADKDATRAAVGVRVTPREA
jgi:hypothetical protein